MAVLHTSVPYSWRRLLGVLRPIFAFACAALYLPGAVPNGYWPALPIIAYAFWAVGLLLRESVESSVYPAYLLFADLALLLFCSLHQGAAGWWLSLALFFYTLAFSVLLYEWKFVAVVGTVSSLIFAMNAAPSVVLPMVLFTAFFGLIMSLHKKTLQDRMVAALKRSVLSRSEAENAREAERQRIAADFHDGPLQSFVSFQMRLEVIRKLLARDVEAGVRELVQLQQLCRSQVTDLRLFVRQMHPTEIKPNTLGAAIRETIEHFERDSGIQAEASCGDMSPLQPEMAGELLQVVREALNNARKHSKASKVTVRLESSTEGADITVEDNGTGFSFDGSYDLEKLENLHMGPRSIRKRVRALGGNLVVESHPAEGSTIKIHVPL